MKYSIVMACLCAVFTTFNSPVRAERALEGHIFLVDSKIVMIFNGYDYGTWDDVGRLDFPALGRSSGGASGWTVGES